jgi:exonuclease SbcC
VVRKCGSTSQYYVYDAEIDQKLTDGKADTMGWLHAFTGVDRSGDLSALFQDAVGVPQGLLTAAFLETVSRRKDVFNPLLRVDEYEEVWAALREPGRCLREDIAEERERIARLEGEVKALPAEKERAGKLSAAIAEDEAARADAQADLDDVTKRKEALAQVKQRLESLEREVAAAEGKAETRKAEWKSAKDALRQAEEAQAVVSETEQGHQAYLEAQEQLDRLDEERDERDRLKAEHQARDKALALAKQQITRLEADLEDIAGAEETLERLRPKVQLQKALEEQLDEAKRAADRLEDRRKTLEERQNHLSRLEEQRAAVEEGLQEATDVEEAIEQLKQDLEASGQKRDRLTSEVAACEAKRDQVREQTETLASTEVATCPVCEGPLTPDHRAELLERNRAMEEDLEEALDGLRGEKADVEEAEQDLQASLDERQARLKTLPRLEEKTKLSDQITSEQEAITEVEQEIVDLADAAAKVTQLSDDLEELGNPRRTYRRAEDTAQRREDVDNELAEAEEEVVELSGQLSALEEDLGAYEDLDERIETQRKARDTHTEDHEQYVAHIREAETLEERQQKVNQQEEALAAAQAELDRLTEERDRVAEDYDAEAYEELQGTYDDLRDTIATLVEGLRRQRKQLEEAEARIEHLTEVEEKLEQARAELVELKELLSLMEFLRQVVRDAGPKVTQALVKVISAQAARLYADIMADRSARLDWTEDYEIILKSNGRERGFQQLSGGEQMAAALAVRLALLKEVSAIDLAFFDEPTANLDDRRRDNLAEQILNVQGFSQLFVISHDDTFEQDTDHVVRVMKEDGRSQTLGE